MKTEKQEFTLLEGERPTTIQIQSSSYHSETRYCCGKCKQNPHLTGVVLSALVWTSFLYAIVRFIMYRLHSNNNSDNWVRLFYFRFLKVNVSRLLTSVDDRKRSTSHGSH